MSEFVFDRELLKQAVADQEAMQEARLMGDEIVMSHGEWSITAYFFGGKMFVWDIEQGSCVVVDDRIDSRRLGRDDIPSRSCFWNSVGSGYETDCVEGFEFNDGGIEGNRFKVCPFCGKPISSEENTSEGSEK